MTDIAFPKTAVDDDDDVVIALETARVQFERGDGAEAARWLHRAASAARKQGRPERAGELSRIASKLAPRAPHETERFEKKPDEPQTFHESDEDFADETVVDKIVPPGLALPAAAIQLSEKADLADFRRSQPPRPMKREAVAAAPTPPVDARGAARSAYRVAVKMHVDGRVEARTLGDGASVGDGEEEALLVFVRPRAN